MNSLKIIKEDVDGTKLWYFKDNLHREDGPAVERPDGTKEWWVNGERHRLDGAAIEWDNGDQEWWVNGELHRLDGPAIQWANGKTFWYLHHKPYASFDDYVIAAGWTDEQVIEWKLSTSY